jgi:hypothetical protein
MPRWRLPSTRLSTFTWAAIRCRATFPPLPVHFSTSFHGIDPANEFFNYGDGFVAKLSASGETLAYSTYLGGSGDDVVYGLATDHAGTVYVTGSTSSPNFPVTPGAVQAAYGGYLSQELPFLIEQNIGDAFVSRLNPQGTSLLYSTFLGGSANDSGQAIAVDPSGPDLHRRMDGLHEFPRHCKRGAADVRWGFDERKIELPALRRRLPGHNRSEYHASDL